ncbi:hypothetical protein PbB2_00529 [Candidatus Phycosocius bacilliformis]|uniref:Uncharacterized protein n=1 Tax=Candidatus Phycosocius bacilliformis TaxID=1445552 RepID=A0A2P2E734_9PROT|nr:hypothetical protein [Candidatus Phycosocius bacilliformis]GBF56872.1 hypothetical protein PbB2_00529 [Candidatus Phycosocius bacilliformis]
MSGIRNLAALATTGSTSRVLNLNLVAKRYRDDPMRKQAPLFVDDLLNRSILVKHRLRRDEAYLLPGSTTVATKIIFPLDFDDLELGGRSIFVNQKGYRQAICDLVGYRELELERDFAVLSMLNDLPSLDPFLVREQLRRNHHQPAECYFTISPADTSRMQSFTTAEMAPLIRMAFDNGGRGGGAGMVSKLADALLSANADTRLDPLRETLGLHGDQFTQGIFSWKGFIYYKWQFSEMVQGLIRVTQEMDQIKPAGRGDQTSREEIRQLKTSIRKRIREAARNCSRVLALYDDAFADLVQRGNTAAFRRFLLEAPLFFLDLGHSMGVISHIISFWNYRFRRGADETPSADELRDILIEFETGLAPRQISGQAW